MYFAICCISFFSRLSVVSTVFLLLCCNCCIPLGLLNRVPALTGWGKGGNVTFAWWQVILCDPIWHVSSRSGEACGELLYPVTLLSLLYFDAK